MLSLVRVLLLGWLLVLPTAVLAKDTPGRPMVGVGAAVVDAQFTGIENDRVNVTVFKAGVVFARSRIYADWSLHTWPEAQTVMIRANYERLFEISPRVQLFAGINTGLVDLDLDSIHVQEDYETGPGLGAQAGLLAHLGAGWYLEAGARYNYYWVDSPSAVSDKVELNSTSEAFVSLVFAY